MFRTSHRIRINEGAATVMSASIASRTIRHLRIAFLLLGLLLSPSVTFSVEAWTTLGRVTGATLTRLSFLDSLNGWVVGDSGTILKTTNGGTTWVQQESNTQWKIHEVFFLDAMHGWALALVLPDTTFEYGTILFKTTNGGEQWTQTWYPDDLYQTLAFQDPLTGWMAGERGKILATTDGGGTWSPAAIDSSNVGTLAIRRMRFFSDRIGMGVGGRVELLGVVWRTTDGGKLWKPAAAGADPILDIHFFDSLNVLGISGGFDDGTSLIRSTNGGERWEYEFIGILGEPRAISFRTGGEAWVPLGFATTAMFTLDSGKTWFEYPTPDNTAMYDLVFTDSLTGYMVGQHGTVLKYRGTAVSVHEQHPRTMSPQAIVLHGNYPNPFNASTVISYELLEEATVTLTLFDGVGREVQVLRLGTQKTGLQTVAIHGNDLASGQYFYRISLVGGNVENRWRSVIGKFMMLR